jgi:hypothetical protein
MRDLADHGLVVIGTEGWVVTTEKGKLALCSLAATLDEIPDHIIIH